MNKRDAQRAERAWVFAFLFPGLATIDVTQERMLRKNDRLLQEAWSHSI